MLLGQMIEWRTLADTHSLTTTVAMMIRQRSHPPRTARGQPVSAAMPSRVVKLVGGSARIGTDRPVLPADGEGPARLVRLKPFAIDPFAVTAGWFRDFVDATGYRTDAEKFGWSAVFFAFLPEALRNTAIAAGASWWRKTQGASWKHPEGPGSSVEERLDHPVVHVSHNDAAAFAAWAGGRLPTEAEWEFAARGGLAGKPFVWGDEFRPEGKWMANTFQGHFPIHDTAHDGYAGIAPVGRFPANGYGLYDMAGNVWQWTSDWYRPDYYQQLASLGVVARNPQGPNTPFDPTEPTERKKVHRGGSYLCTDQYCSRYIVGTRGKGEISTGTNHLGFRCIMTREQRIAKN